MTSVVGELESCPEVIKNFMTNSTKHEIFLAGKC